MYAGTAFFFSFPLFSLSFMCLSPYPPYLWTSFPFIFIINHHLNLFTYVRFELMTSPYTSIIFAFLIRQCLCASHILY